MLFFALFVARLFGSNLFLFALHVETDVSPYDLRSIQKQSEMEFYASQLAAKGILVVTVQYRVGVFGFLALKELSQESPDGTPNSMARIIPPSCGTH